MKEKLVTEAVQLVDFTENDKALQKLDLFFCKTNLDKSNRSELITIIKEMLG